MVNLNHSRCPALLIIQDRVRLDQYMISSLAGQFWVLQQTQEQYHCQGSPNLHSGPQVQPSSMCYLVGWPPLANPTAHQN